MMIRYREDPTATILTIAGVVLLAASLAFMLFAPKPTVAGLAAQGRNAQFKVKLDTQTAEERMVAANSYIATTAWSDSAQRVTPQALAVVTALAQKHRLNLVQFRPQRVDEKTVPAQLPFLITVTGEFPNVVAFARDLDVPTTRMTVTLVQLSSADANNSRVTGNIGAVAFLNPPKPVEGGTTTKTKEANGA